MLGLFRYRLGLQFFNGDGTSAGAGEVGGGEVSGASTSVESEGVASSQGAEGVQGSEELPEGGQPEGTETGETIDQSKAFAKRLSEKIAQERQAWEQESQEKYKGYDQFQRMSDFFMKQSGYQNADELMTAIEQQELLQRAQEFGVTPEIQQRLEDLESKAQRAEELEKQQQQQETYRQYRQHLDTFAQEKGIDAKELEDFMIKNDVPSFEVAHNALRTQKLEEQLKTAKQDAIKEYLESKKAPKVEGSGATGVLSDEPTTDFGVARQRALQRLRAANQEL